MKLSEVKLGDVFKVADIEFIKVAENGDQTIAVAKDTVFNASFGSNNDFRKSNVLDRLQKEILPKLEKSAGAENIKEFELDLTALDGLDTYGNITTKIGLPTVDFYRQNVRIFDKYKLDCWWWLATPETTPEHNDDYWACCVSPFGDIFYNYCNDFSGVRPFLHFVSSISLSCEE